MSTALHVQARRLVLVALVLGSGLVVSPALGAEDNPFARPAIQVVDTRAEVPPAVLELAGVSCIGGQMLVCLRDRESRRARWLTLGVPVEGTLASEYDPVQDAVLVRVGSVSSWVAMRKTSVAALAVYRLDDGSVDWAHQRMSERDKALEAEAMLTDILEAGRLARAGRLDRTQAPTP